MINLMLMKTDFVFGAISIVYTFPFTLMTLILSLQLSNAYSIKNKKDWIRAIQVAAIWSVLFALLTFLISDWLNLLLGGIFLLILLIIFYRELKLKIKGIIFIFQFLICSMLHVIFSALCNLKMPDDRFLLLISSVSLLIGIVSYFVLTGWVVKESMTYQSIVQRLTKSEKMKLGLLCLFLLVQSLILLLFTILFTYINHGLTFWQDFLILALLYLSSLLTFIVLLHRYSAAYSAAHKVEINDSQEVHATDITNLFNTLRSQRHDFNNHMSMLQGLVRSEKYTEVDKYITVLIGETQNLNDIMEIGNPFLGALIYAKIARAKKENINFTYSFENIKNIDKSVKVTDYTKILGNLIDNAFEAVVNDRRRSKRTVNVKVWVINDRLYLMVSNPASLGELDNEKLFEAGYSSNKGSSAAQRGLGLSIVKSISEIYGGKVDVYVQDGYVYFEVVILLTEDK